MESNQLTEAELTTALQKVSKALKDSFGFETVQSSVNTNQIRLSGRVPQAHTKNWLVGVDHILEHSGEHGWTVDPSRKYFKRNGSLVWCWRVIFQGDIVECAHSIVKTCSNAPRAAVELQEQQLPGVTGPRNMMSESGKGASAGGSTPLLIRKRSGQ